MMHIKWDSRTPVVKGAKMTVTINTGQTVSFSNTMESLALQYPREYVAIQESIKERLSDYAALDASGVPNVPDLAVIAYQLPDGRTKYAVVVSVLEITSKDGKNPAGHFRTIVGNIEESEKLLTYFVPLEKLLA